MDVVELQEATRCASTPAIGNERALPGVAEPDGTLDGGGDVAGALPDLGASNLPLRRIGGAWPVIRSRTDSIFVIPDRSGSARWGLHAKAELSSLDLLEQTKGAGEDRRGIP